MSTRYTLGEIDTLPKWNAVLAAACCCELPACPIPNKECEAKSVSASESEGSEGQTAETPWPPDTTYGRWAQFERPAGADDDPLPVIYRKLVVGDPSSEEILLDGVMGKKTASNDWNSAGVTPWIQASFSEHGTVTFDNELQSNAGVIVESFHSATYNSAGTNLTCDSTPSAEVPDWRIDNGGVPWLPDLPWSVSPESGGEFFWSEIDAKQYVVDGHEITYDSGRWRLLFGSPQSVDSCPGPWGQAFEAAFLKWDWADLYAKGAEQTKTMSDGITRAGLIGAAQDLLAEEEFASGSCSASFALGWPTIDDFDWEIAASSLWTSWEETRVALASVAMTEVRFRWGVPEAHTGTWYKVAWDIIEEPEGWEESETEIRSYVSRNNVWEWTRPEGTLSPEDLLSDWYSILPPSTPGSRRVINGRVWHFRSPYGSLPTPFGDQINLPVLGADIEAGGLVIGEGWLMGAARPGDDPVVVAITIRNTGTVDLTISDITSSDAAITVGDLPEDPIAPAGTAVVLLTFTPGGVAEIHTATITVIGNLPGGSITFDAHAVTYVSDADVCSSNFLDFYMQTSSLAHRLVFADGGKWMEVGFQMDVLLDGSANAGWTGPGGVIGIGLLRSTDLVTWTGGWTDVGTPTEVSTGVWEYWARPAVPIYWDETLSDHRFTSDLYGKSVTAIYLGNSPTPIDLPNYPYAIPADAAALQADLIADLGLDVEVTTTSGALIARAYNHAFEPVGRLLPVTMSGNDVTEVRHINTPISLPGYPYSMPSQRAALQADLRAAGRTSAVVTLHAGELDILIPDLPNFRTSRIIYSPADPFDTWTFFGSYAGEVPGNQLDSVEENLRDPLGNPLVEVSKQFARLAVTREM